MSTTVTVLVLGWNASSDCEYGLSRKLIQSNRQSESTTSLGTDPTRRQSSTDLDTVTRLQHIVLVCQTPLQLQSFVLLIARRAAGGTRKQVPSIPAIPHRRARRTRWRLRGFGDQRPRGACKKNPPHQDQVPDRETRSGRRRCVKKRRRR
jgi:hypothetical protein